MKIETKIIDALTDYRAANAAMKHGLTDEQIEALNSEKWAAFDKIAGLRGITNKARACKVFAAEMALREGNDAAALQMLESVKSDFAGVVR